MGNISNMIKGIPEDKLFSAEPPAGYPVKSGVEAQDRTFLNKAAHRDIVENLVVNISKRGALKSAILALSKETDTNIVSVRNVLQHIASLKSKKVKGVSALNAYSGLLTELYYQTPISALVSSTNKKALNTLRSFLNEETAAFTNVSTLEVLTTELPVLSFLIAEILAFEGKKKFHYDGKSVSYTHLTLPTNREV